MTQAFEYIGFTFFIVVVKNVKLYELGNSMIRHSVSIVGSTKEHSVLYAEEYICTDETLKVVINTANRKAIEWADSECYNQSIKNNKLVNTTA